MTPCFKKILCAVDLDEGVPAALDLARRVAHESDSEVVVLHVVPIVFAPEEAPLYADLYKSKAEDAHRKIADMVRKHLRGVKNEIRAEVGHPATVIVKLAKELPADLLVMTTHRRKFSRFFLGSIAEPVMREVQCPVLTAKNPRPDRLGVAQWMTALPVIASPNDTLAAVSSRMREGGFRSVPVVSEGKLLGIITDRDLGPHLDHMESLKVEKAMNRDLTSLTPDTSILDASLLLSEHRIGALPVVEDGQVVGIISTTDLLKAFTELQ
jgi:acetoin utilization protein AcuB